MDAATDCNTSESTMTHANDVRTYCVTQYIQPARAAGHRIVSIRAGDVHSALGYSNRLPLVCAAIGALLFCEENSVRRTAIAGPTNGANTVYEFELLAV